MSKMTQLNLTEQDQEILENIRQNLKSSVSADNQIAAMLWVNHFGQFKAERDILLIEEFLYQEVYPEDQFKTFSEELLELYIKKFEEGEMPDFTPPVIE